MHSFLFSQITKSHSDIESPRDLCACDVSSRKVRETCLISFLKHGCSTCDVTIAVVGIQSDEASIPVQLKSLRGPSWMLFRLLDLAIPSSIFFQIIFMLPFNVRLLTFDGDDRSEVKPKIFCLSPPLVTACCCFQE